MKRVLMITVIAAAVYACDKATDVTYDSHLFAALQAKNWVFDSATATDSTGRDSVIHLADTIEQIHQFSSQLYTISNIKVSDSAVLDTTSYQIIYSSPNHIYFYNIVSQQIIPNQYIDIDTVNTEALILTKTDTLKTVSRSYYHAE